MVGRGGVLIVFGPVTIKDMQTSPPPEKWPSWHKRCAMSLQNYGRHGRPKGMFWGTKNSTFFKSSQICHLALPLSGWFETNRISIQFQINWRMVNTIWYLFIQSKAELDFTVCYWCWFLTQLNLTNALMSSEAILDVRCDFSLWD